MNSEHSARREYDLVCEDMSEEPDAVGLIGDLHLQCQSTFDEISSFITKYVCNKFIYINLPYLFTVCKF